MTNGPNVAAPLLRCQGVSKRFGATVALADVAFEVGPGEVRALIGENGAGKSTLMKILAGIYRPDAGTIELSGRGFAPSGPAAARTAGVAMIHQELSLAPHLSVEANILLGQERGHWGLVDRDAHRQLAQRALAQLGQEHLPLDVPVAKLPIAKQQLVEIARALASDARVLIFDEPTSSLTEEDTAHLFQAIARLRGAGLGVIYISHFLEEVAQVADVYSVLRDGRIVAQGAMAAASQADIVRQMVGRELTEMFPHVEHQVGEPVLELFGLSGVEVPRDVSLTLRSGEILGLAGLVGAGRSELLRAIFGLEPVRAGRVTVAARGSVGQSPAASMRRGLGLVSEDRKAEGLAVAMSIADNLTLNCLAPYARAGWLNLRRRDAAARDWMARVACKARGPGQPIGELSGGNQQKIAIARLLHQQADVLLLDEPTRGIDVGTKAEVYRLIGHLAAQGKSILMVSSYLPELLNVCDRIGVMCRGRLRALRPAAEWTDEAIMHVATGGA
ncbi:MAG: sugar ABC transporter ATP-binding protein [Pirellulales bacterium]|nr:sugar ABC transporter ATP-binding protein [Pirellulales bacterium]